MKWDWLVTDFLLSWYFRKDSFPKDWWCFWPHNWKYQCIKLCSKIIITLSLWKVCFRVTFLKILTQGLHCLTGQATPRLPASVFSAVEWGGWWSETLPLASASSIVRAVGSSGCRLPWEAHCEWPRGVLLKETNCVPNLYQCRIIQIVNQNNIPWHLRTCALLELQFAFSRCLNEGPCFG